MGQKRELAVDEGSNSRQSAYASDILYVISIWLTKCSMVFLFRRLSADKRHIFLLNLLSGGVLLLGVASIFVVALRCTLSRPWDFIDDHCTSQLAQWEAVAAFDIFTEALLAATPIFIIYGLQMPLNKKLAILVAFALRLLFVHHPPSSPSPSPTSYGNY